MDSASITNVGPAPATDVARWTGELEGLGYTAVKCVLHMGTRHGICSARWRIVETHRHECNGSDGVDPETGMGVAACRRIE